MSKSKWESSYFGGPIKILWDYPTMVVKSGAVFFNNKPSASLYDYGFNKLMTIFEKHIREFNFTSIYTDKMKDSSYNERSYDYGKGYVNVSVPAFLIDKEQQRYCLDSIISKNVEIKELFVHFYEVMINADIFYPMYDVSDTSSGGSSISAGAGKKSIDDRLDKIVFGTRFTYGNTINNATIVKDTRFIKINKNTRKTIFSKQNEKDAKLLLNKMDITFDPKKDIVDNLISGKISPHKIATIQTGNTHIYRRIEENVSVKPFSVCILMDESGSMGGVRTDYLKHDTKTWCAAEYQQSCVKTLYRAFSEILPPDKIYVYGHSGLTSPDIHIYQDYHNPDFEETIDNQSRVDFSENYDGPVIEKIYNKVRSFTNENILFISLSDGSPSGVNYGGYEARRDMKRIIEKCRRDGFATVGVGILSPHVKSIYNYHCVIKNLDDLVPKVSNLINTVVRTEFKED